jgi:hypothetical protein
VSCGIALKNDVISTLADDDAIAHDNGAVRLIALRQGFIAKCARP